MMDTWPFSVYVFCTVYIFGYPAECLGDSVNEQKPPVRECYFGIREDDSIVTNSAVVAAFVIGSLMLAALGFIFGLCGGHLLERRSQANRGLYGSVDDDDEEDSENPSTSTATGKGGFRITKSGRKLSSIEEDPISQDDTSSPTAETNFGGTAPPSGVAFYQAIGSPSSADVTTSSSSIRSRHNMTTYSEPDRADASTFGMTSMTMTSEPNSQVMLRGTPSPPRSLWSRTKSRLVGMFKTSSNRPEET